MQPSAGVSILWRLSIRHVEFVRWGSRDCSLLPHNTMGQRRNIAPEQHDALKTHSLYMFYNHYMAGYQAVTFFLQFCIRAIIQVYMYIYIYVIIYIDIFISLSLSIYISLYLHIHHTFYRRTFQCIFTCTVHEARNKQTNQFGSTWGASLEQLQLLHWQFFHHGKMSLAQQRGNGKYGFLMVFGRSQGCVAFFFGSGKFQSKARKRYRKTILDVLCHDTWHPIR